MLNNLNLLYIIFLCTLINIGYFLYRKDFQSILIFIVCCIVIYMINKNMIIVLGISILFVNALGMVRMFKKEGFINDSDEDIKENMTEIDSDNESDDSDNDYMQDKDVIKKIKKLNPKILKSLNKLNSIDIKEINTYINTLKDVIDP